MFLERLDVCDNANIQSLVKSEFDTVRAQQRSLSTDWRLGTNRFGMDCSGLLFHLRTCFATNGHWAIKVRTHGEFADPNETTLFYDYLSDDFYPGFNPFHMHYQIPPEAFYSVFSVWNASVVKVRVADIVGVANSVAATIRARRSMYVTINYAHPGYVVYKLLPLGECVLTTPYSGEPFPEVILNLSYFAKIASIIDNYFHLADMCISACEGENVIIKAKSRGDNVPDLRFALAQALL